jgi:hypothetical protein
MAEHGCSECGRKTMYLWRVWRSNGGICGTCCNEETARGA